jgi:predicted amidohydrolase YtcJ
MPDLFDWDFHRHAGLGNHVTLGSDWGGGFDASVLQYVAPVVEKVGGGSKELGGEMLCRIMTLAGAEAVGKQAEFGSIEVGKKANFISVSQNLAKGEFDGAKVLKTWFEGEMVWDESDP